MKVALLIAIVGLLSPAAQAQTRNNCTTICNSSGQCVTRCGFGYQMEETPPPEVEPVARSMVICPFFGPCWKDGEPTDAAGVPITHYFPNYKHPFAK